MIKIYYSRPFSGRKISYLKNQLSEFKNTFSSETMFSILDPIGLKLDCLSRMCPEEDDLEAAVSKYSSGYFSSKLIFNSDYKDVQECDIIVCDLTDIKSPSVGCCFEIAWAFQLRKPIFIVSDIPESNLHPFIRESATVVCLSLTDLFVSLHHYLGIR